MNGGVFYTDHASEVIVDTQLPVPPPSQNLLIDSLRRYNDLVQRDMRYAHLVAGASKMPMNMIWSARNQDELVNDLDLAKLKSLAWNEFIQKRYLPAITGGQSLASTASSMLEIVREMNLQRRRFQIMGLHEQVEASEIQLVLHLCQAQIIRSTTNTAGEYRSLANRFRRHDRLYEAFALAVGAFVCSSAPFTLGSGTTRYERDLQFEYRKHNTALFVYVLQQHPGALVEAVAFDEDYVLRISRLIVLWPSSGGGGGGFLESVPDAPPPPDDRDKELILNAVATAQTQAEKAERMAGKAMRDMQAEVRGVRTWAREYVDNVAENHTDRLSGMINQTRDQIQASEQARLQAIEQARLQALSDSRLMEERLKTELHKLMIDWLTAGRPGDASAVSGITEILRRDVMGEVADQMAAERRRMDAGREVERRAAADLKDQEKVDAIDKMKGVMQEVLDSQGRTSSAEIEKLRDELNRDARNVEQRCSDRVAGLRTASEAGVAALRAESVAEHTARCGAEAGLTEALQRIIQSLSGHSAPPNISSDTDLFRHNVDLWARGVAQQSAESEQRLHALETGVEALGSQVNDADARRADYETKVRQSMDGISAQLQESSTGVKAEYSALNGRVQQFTDGLETSMDMIMKIEEKLESMEETNERVDSNLELLQAYFDPGLGYEEAFFKFDAPFEERLLEIVSERFRLTPNQEREEDNRAEVMNRGAIMELIAEQLRGVRVNPQGAQGRKRRMDDDNEEEYDSASPSPAASTPRRSRTGDLQPQPPSIANPSQEMEPRLRRLEKEVARLLGQDGDDIYDRPPPPPDGTADYLPPATQQPP
jgi:hypothetical protein